MTRIQPDEQEHYYTLQEHHNNMIEHYKNNTLLES